MNHIQELTIQRDGLSIELSTYFDAINELKHYLLSDKFSVDTTVQVKDVLHRLSEAENAALNARDAADNAAYRKVREADDAKQARGKANCERCQSFGYNWAEAEYQDGSWHIICQKCRETADVQSRLKGN